MTPDEKEDLDNALLAYWVGRNVAKAAQQTRGVADVGERASVTSDTHLYRVTQLFARVCIAAGVPKEQVFYKVPKDDPDYSMNMDWGTTLPGYYRPTKQWDLIVHFKNEPVIAIELKSQSGPSYSNNANNRVEEAIGNAEDLIRAHEANLIPLRPWMGYVYVIEDDIVSRRNGRGKADASFLKQDPIFASWSYISRVDILCRRLVEEGFYNSAWAIATSRPIDAVEPDSSPKQEGLQLIFDENIRVGHEHEFNWREPNPQLTGYSQFITALTTEIDKYYPTALTSGKPNISAQS